MHLSTLLTSLVTLGLPLVTLTSAAALDTTTSVSTSRISSTYSASVSTSTSKSTTTSAPDSTSPQTIEEYIKDKLADQSATNNNSTTTNDITSIKHVQGMTIEVPTCCWNGCRTCSSKICGKGANGCNEWPYYSCCATIIIWDIGRDVMLDAFTTAGQTVEFEYD
ncbi:uncharacterized protein B0T23DRAFT_396479 [Neurospora hispaniola]|uniref:Uncharacterized protein n=1 Tax=Neurospora hispaniola TaxID=588809 RepID=A0AAJ0MQ43_9PEZI|nr:hypothetical protein B0T23DRAFT_396479 [Neurospora hispaniola]